ncbi:cytochrome b/b6 domain-containing protein [uncultured Enterovirga sp.]|uniref:cytochrome b/b6 domain-containing protein n=1 Tax=uncultured Enterovirga sp. TaxID=2026352 RepID=UPI0035CA7375
MSAEAAGAAGGTQNGEVRSVRAWDGPTRLFKWSLVLLVLNAWLTYLQGDAGMPWHILNGYGILILLVFRLIWGFVGSSTSRFSHWVVWPWTALSHGAGLLRGRSRKFLGHNPLGSWMIIALLAIAASQGIAGLFTVDNNGLVGGPFANLDFGDPTPVQRAFSRWHHLGFYVLMGFAVVHVLVNLWYQFAKYDPLITGMVTGRKPALDYADEPEMRPASATWLRAGLCFLAAAAIVFGSVRLFGGKLPF